MLLVKLNNAKISTKVCLSIFIQQPKCKNSCIVST